MDKYFWANFISFAMSGTLSEKHYKDLNSVDSFIKSVGDNVSVFSLVCPCTTNKLLLTVNSFVAVYFLIGKDDFFLYFF